MATPEPDPTVPKTFISYSWDDDAHKEWVKQLATRLRADGVDVTLDRWHAAPGDQIPAFMERTVRENNFVIAVCTPRFKERSDGRGGGVGYEGDIMTAYALTGGNRRKFIPVLRRGSWSEAAPTWLIGRAKIDLSRDPYSESEYEELVQTLHSAREGAPPIGRPPYFVGGEQGSQRSLRSVTDAALGKRAKELVTRYAADPDGALHQLCDEYIDIYNRVHLDKAREFLKKFEAELQRAHKEVEDRSHREILELLREGPPIDVHLEGLVEVRDGATLFSHPAFPRLLLGIRKMEKSHKEAIKHLEAMRQERDMPRCALFKYILGQCYRKVKQLYDAQTMLEAASRDAGRCKDGCCICIVPGCQISELRLAIYRGRGAVHRELKEWDEAEHCFQEALRYVEDENVSKYIRNSIKCDFYYTFGYYMFKKSFDQGDRQKNHLRKALKRFGDAHQLCEDRSAPLSRIAIVKHLLHEASFKDFLKAWHLAYSEQNIKAPLTAAMCGFGLLMMALEAPRRFVLTEKKLYDDLRAQLPDAVLPSGGARLPRL